MTEQGFRFAGWVLLDLRLTGALAVFSAALAAVVLALWFRGKRWDEYAVAFAAVFGVCFLGGLLVTNGLASYPALSIQSFFAVP